MSLREDGFWDEYYASELKNYEEDGCESELWFGKGLSRRIVNWINKNLSLESERDLKVLDVGCGAAFLLIALVEHLGHMNDSRLLLGIDYSKNSVDLSRKIVAERGFSREISLEQCDFLKHDQLKVISQGHKFDYIIDVGTYDAICLLAGSNIEETKQKYMRSVNELVKDGSIFILASCNHTEEDLMALLSPEYVLIDRIETPKLKFGGKEGSQVNCLIHRFEERKEKISS